VGRWVRLVGGKVAGGNLKVRYYFRKVVDDNLFEFVFNGRKTTE